MTQLILTVPKETEEKMLISMPRSVKLNDLIIDAVSLYAWAIEERKKGRIICSSNADLTDVRKITTDSLDSLLI